MNYRGPMTDEMLEILHRLDQELDRDGAHHDELLQIEMTLRGMLPALEAQLQGQFDGQTENGPRVDAAVQGLMTMSANLMWIQLHAQSGVEVIRGRLRDSVRGAEQALTLAQREHLVRK